MSDKALTMLATRTMLWLGFYGVVLLAWWAMYDMARGGGDWLCGPGTIRLLPLGGFWALLPMWAVMMVAMMLPTLFPTLSTYDDLIGRPGATQGGWIGIILGYAIVWLIGSAAFAGFQVFALNNGLIDLTGIVTSPWLAAVLFALAGIYQFSKVKEACQDACLTPMQYFMANWRPEFTGGVRMGLGIGAFCVGCCWAIMALAFVGGTMSLLWMGLATVFMVAEKLPDIGQYLRKPAGVALLGTSLFMVLRAMGWV